MNQLFLLRQGLWVYVKIPGSKKTQKAEETIYFVIKSDYYFQLIMAFSYVYISLF